ncbi:hypothetical protein, partial [Novilysobacter arseniciresistens]|uniref:hypothetical protein n=1 Tax=Novilysobacter arseniciresistens TaxID=1385522 RepID=UPI001939BB42
KGAAGLEVLPDGAASTSEQQHWIGLHYLDPETGDAIDGAEYEIHFVDGPVISGTLDEKGRADHENVEKKEVEKVVYKPRVPEEDSPHAALEEILVKANTQRVA